MSPVFSWPSTFALRSTSRKRERETCKKEAAPGTYNAMLDETICNDYFKGYKLEEMLQQFRIMPQQCCKAMFR